MKPIRQFQITGMTISGFKSYETPTELTFGVPTVITGGNGRGKTSIADAIAFAVTGFSFFGERGLDRLHNEANGSIYISLRFLDENGTPHELVRTRQKNRMTITYDGYEVRQLDLSDLFGEKDVFLSILNPLYFIEELGENGKNLLERYLPRLSQAEVLAELSEPVRQRLEKEEILSPDAFLKSTRAEVHALEEKIIYLNGQRDQALVQSQKRTEQSASLPQRYKALKEELAALEEKQFAGLNPSTMEERLVELSAQYDESRRDQHSESEEERSKLREKLAARRAEAYQPKYTEVLAEARARLNTLAAQYNREGASYQSLAAGTACPVCHRPITKEALPGIQKKIQDTAAALLAEGQTAKAQVKELEELEKKAQDTFERFKADDLQKWQAEAEALESQRQNEDSSEDLRRSIQTLTADLEYGNLSQEEYDRLNACREEFRQCGAELTALRSMTDPDLTGLDQQIEQAKEKIVELKKLIADVVIYAGKRAEMTFSALKLNRVEISLYDVVKSTGERKDAFKFNYNGRRYDRLSLSEKIRAGMEVSQLVMRLTGRSYPVFVDNMESVDDLKNVRPQGQLIFAKCVSKAPLQVRPVRPILAAQAKAA